jgi:hypothetical protein
MLFMQHRGKLHLLLYFLAQQRGPPSPSGYSLMNNSGQSLRGILKLGRFVISETEA